MGRAIAAKYKHPLWVVHRRELVSQAPPEVEAVTIQGLVASGRRPDCDLLIWDEAHHVKAEEWGRVAEDYRHIPILGLTATPQRSDGKPLGDIFQSMVVAVQYSELLDRELIVPCRVVRPDRVLDGAAQEPVKIYQEYAPGTQCFAFAASVKAAEEMAHAFCDIGVSAACISAQTPKEQRDESMQAFREGRLQVLSNVNCLDEETEILTSRGWVGIDGDTQGVRVAQWELSTGKISFAEPTSVVCRKRGAEEGMVSLRSNRRHIRVTEAHRMAYRTLPKGTWKEAPARDLIGRNLEIPVSGIIQRDDTLSAIEQEVYRTDLQRAIATNACMLRKRNPGRYSLAESRVVAERRLIRRRSLRYKQPEELALAECAFIGMWMADGQLQKLRKGGVEYKLLQPKANAPICQWIKDKLQECGFDYVERWSKADGYTWSIPHGTGFGSQQREGVYRIEPFLTKKLIEPHWRLSTSQFESLLYGFWLGNGNHGRDGNGTNKNSYRVCSANKPLLDALQALACCHGFRTRIYYNGTTWVMSYRKTDHHCTSKAGATLEPETQWAPERVWCVSVPTGFIVTRRRGAVTIVGNCLTEGVNVPAAQTVLLAKNVSHVGAYMQIAGRVLRADEGKTHATLIDCFGVSHKRGFGFPTDDRTYSLDGVAMRSADKELKTCPQCRTVVHRSELTCSHCGYAFPKPPPTKREKELRIYNVELRMCYKGDETPEPAKRREWERISQFARSRDWSLSWAMKEWRKLFPQSGYPPTTESEQIKELARLMAHQQARGFKPGWVGFRFKDTFGEWPNARLKAHASVLSRQMGEAQRAELRCSDCGATARLQWQGSEKKHRTIRRTCKECGMIDFAKVNPQTTAAANLQPPWAQDDLPF